ncbi:MAG: 3-methyl-2-oxobutanoate hydroxymethyltransferase [Deltaproteobacteria bacterium]|nr:3-methyl-2-oxobutanoate hydroxymethyltransferase [Deltaproteobacteria bacterium]
MTSPTVPQRISVPFILQSKTAKPSRKLVATTAYDFTSARLIDSAGVDLILVGDSLGSVVQGLETTIPVTLDEMVYHCRCVTRGVKHALVVGDMPFMSFQVSPEKALEAAGRLLKEGGVSAVKVEGGVAIAETIRRLVSVDIPVVGHIGLTPQSYHRMGGYTVQGKKSGSTEVAGTRDRVIADALAVERAGAFACVLEGLPSDLASEITEMLHIPTIGIGAGKECDGQILVSTDLLGMNPDFAPKFVKRYANLAEGITSAVTEFTNEVRAGKFPLAEHSFQSSVKRSTASVSSLKIAR